MNELKKQLIDLKQKRKAVYEQLVQYDKEINELVWKILKDGETKNDSK